MSFALHLNVEKWFINIQGVQNLKERWKVKREKCLIRLVMWVIKRKEKKKSRDKKCQVSVVLFEPLRCETKNTLKCIVYLQIQSKKLASLWWVERAFPFWFSSQKWLYFFFFSHLPHFVRGKMCIPIDPKV